MNNITILNNQEIGLVNGGSFFIGLTLVMGAAIYIANENKIHDIHDAANNAVDNFLDKASRATTMVLCEIFSFFCTYISDSCEVNGLCPYLFRALYPDNKEPKEQS